MCNVVPGLALFLAPIALAAGPRSDINGGSNGEGAAPTQINEIVMYAVDDDTRELVRYWFGAANPMTIDVLAYADGTTVGDVECLGFVPSGPHKGLYGVDNYNGDDHSRLVKINVFTATATPIGDLGYGNVEGMVAAWDPGQNKWVLYATHSGGGNEDPVGDGGLEIKWWVDGTLAATLTPAGTYGPAFGGSWGYQGQQIGPDGVTLTWDCVVRADWILGGGFWVTNPTDDAVEVVVEMTAPLSVLLEAGTQMQGSAGLGLTADGGGGTLAALPGQPLWQALIDGSTAVPSFYTSPYELTAAPAGSTADSVNFGPMNGPPATQSIGIKAGFSLSPFDTMSTTGVFTVGGDATEVAAQNLIRIDPSTGGATLVQPLDRRFEGLARAENGVLYAARDFELWSINLASGAVTEVGSHAYAEVEALEYAFGYGNPRVNVPGVPGNWTHDGALFGFSDAGDTMVVIDPASGQAIEYDCPIDMDDLEGVVFLTQMNDPFGDVIASVGD